MWKFWERSDVKKHLSLPLFLSVAIGFVFLLYWAVDCLPLSIAGKLVVAGVVSLLFLFAGAFLLIKDWRRKVVEEYVASKKGKKQGLVLS
jgi:membrane protein YdbS with pleckstrin-like domain